MDKNQKKDLGSLQKKVKDLEASLMQQQKILKALEESENRYRMIFDYANDGIILHDLEGGIIDVNHNMYRRLGYSKQEFLQMSLKELVTPEFEEKIKARVKKLKREGVAVFESADRRKDGTFMQVEVSARLVEYNGRQIIQSIVRDINDRKTAEELITTALKEKEILLAEIQKRVKFKNRVFSHVLELLSHKKKSEELIASLAAARSRLESMTFIEDKVYRCLNFSRIDFSEIVRGITTYLFSLHRIGIKKIHIKREIHDIYLDIHRTIPCALIVNELLTNSLQHAFPGDKEGEIIVKLSKTKRGYHILIIKDNGIGSPSHVNLRRVDTLGMRLVKDLAAELEGNVTARTGRGTEFRISFKWAGTDEN